MLVATVMKRAAQGVRRAQFRAGLKAQPPCPVPVTAIEGAALGLAGMARIIPCRQQIVETVVISPGLQIAAAQFGMGIEGKTVQIPFRPRPVALPALARLRFAGNPADRLIDIVRRALRARLPRIAQDIFIARIGRPAVLEIQAAVIGIAVVAQARALLRARCVIA